jgi:hypothetical protein
MSLHREESWPNSCDSLASTIQLRGSWQCCLSMISFVYILTLSNMSLLGSGLLEFGASSLAQQFDVENVKPSVYSPGLVRRFGSVAIIVGE